MLADIELPLGFYHRYHCTRFSCLKYLAYQSHQDTFIFIHFHDSNMRVNYGNVSLNLRLSKDRVRFRIWISSFVRLSAWYKITRSLLHAGSFCISHMRLMGRLPRNNSARFRHGNLFTKRDWEIADLSHITFRSLDRSSHSGLYRSVNYMALHTDSIRGTCLNGLWLESG